MIRESRGKVEKLDASFSAKAMFPLAIADSIDALAVGVTFAFLEVNIIPAVLLIVSNLSVLCVGNKKWK
jgi:putative Mn2+ efflux pump MntP